MASILSRCRRLIHRQNIPSPAGCDKANEIYLPLKTERDEIRLLYLFPGRDDGIPRCELRTVSLDDENIPDYEAISYCWQEHAGLSTAFINGVLAEIPKSAAVALQRYRLIKEPRVVWIDAVCIDQGNIRERGNQVQLCGQIYSRSRQTLVWLGEADIHTPKASSSIRKYAALITPYKDEFLQKESARSRETILSQVVPLPPDFDHDAVHSYFSRKWFSRLWVFQEATLAPISVCSCGDFDVDWQDVGWVAFALITGFAFNPIPTLPYSAIGISIASRSLMVRINQVQIDLSDLLTISHDLEVSEPRDNVYGMLGLTTWGKQLSGSSGPLRIDYERPIRDVFRAATREAIKESRDLSLLTLIEMEQREESDPSFPSWVPDWHWDVDYRLTELRSSSSRADGGIPMVLEDETFDTDRLRVKGVHAARVVQKSEVFDVGATDEEKIAVCDAFAQGRHFSAEDDTLRFMTGFIHCLIPAEMFRESSPPALASEDEGDKFSDVEITLSQAAGRLDRSTDTPESRQDQFILDLLEYRRLFTTDTGELGVGPARTEVGDDIVILFGAPYPAILRRTGASFKFVGYSIIIGMMDGEVVKEQKDVEDSSMMFDIY